jgi:hypothetical protein
MPTQRHTKGDSVEQYAVVVVVVVTRLFSLLDSNGNSTHQQARLPVTLTLLRIEVHLV